MGRPNSWVLFPVLGRGVGSKPVGAGFSAQVSCPLPAESPAPALATLTDRTTMQTDERTDPGGWASEG